MTATPAGRSDSAAPHPDEQPGRHTGAARPDRRSESRLLLLVCLALAGAAGALEGAARVAWFTGGVDAVGRGTVTVTADGADLLPALSAVALLALAAVAAAVAVVASVGPQLAQLWRSAPAGQPGGTPGQVVVTPDRALEFEINQLAFDKWAHPDDNMIDALADETEETTDLPRTPTEGAGGSVVVASGAGLGDGPIFDIPLELDLPEPAQP